MNSIEIKAPESLTADEVAFWNELHGSDRSLTHPQLHVEWVQLAARVSPATFVAIIRSGNEIRGAFAFERLSRSGGQAVAGILSDRHAIMARPDTELKIPELLGKCGLKFWKFDHLPTTQSFLREYFATTDPAALVDLSLGYDSYEASLQQLHTSWHQQIQRKRRKLIREVGALRFELHSDDPSAMQALLTWKQEQLTRAGIYNVYGQDWAQRLLQLVAQHQTAGFAGWLSVLFAGSQIVAVHLGQRSGPEFNSWIPAYHPDFARYSPGALLQLELLQRCGDEGVASIDLGRGSNPLKATLATAYVDLAIGSADTRFLGRRVGQAKRAVRTAAEKLPPGRLAIRACRQASNWLRNR